MADDSEAWEVCAEASQLAVVRERVRRFAERTGMQQDEADAAILAASEAAGNAVRHAYPYGGRSETVRVELQVVGDSLTLAVTDDGVGWRSATHSPGAGLGLRIIDQLAVDRAMTEGPNGGTRLTIRFALSAHRAQPPAIGATDGLEDSQSGTA